jgi:NAD(P)-dependent dehydrogenase (short-subunit alcohol dehydrogenase family)
VREAKVMVAVGEPTVSPPAAFVTGAASPTGIGAAVVRRLARDGWAVLAFDLDPRLDSTVRGIRAELGLPEARLVARIGDVSDATDIDAAVVTASGLGSLRLAVANAGTAGLEDDLVDQDVSAFDRIVAVNLRGVFLTCRAAGRMMRDARAGSIVTVSSIFGQEPFARAAAYSATKAGVIALTQALARELAPFGVRVNSVAPGYIATEMQAGAQRTRAWMAGITFEEEGLRVDGMVPLGRHGTGDDVAGAVAFLASPEASYITGHTLGVTGGVVMR